MKREYIHYGHKHFDKSLFKEVRGWDNCTNKPYGGLWGSPVDTDWGWMNWCVSEQFHLDRYKDSFKFTLENGSKVFHIRNRNDIFKLPVAKYPDPNSFSCIGWYYDWDKIAKKYDAVELHFSNDYSLFHDVFYCWDVDSIIVLNPDIIREIEE